VAAIPIKPEITASILTDWRIGNTSQRKLAQKYSVSIGTVSNICKGVEQDGVSIVNAGTQYRQALAAHDEQMVNAIEQAVSEKTKHIQFFNNATVKNLSVMLTKIKPEVVKKGVVVEAGTSINDHRIAQAAIKDGRETVLGKDPTTAVQINDNSEQGGKWIIEVSGNGAT
jgi:transposase